MKELDIYVKVINKRGTRFIRYFFKPGIISSDIDFFREKLGSGSVEKTTLEEKIARATFKSGVTNLVEFLRTNQLTILVALDKEALVAENIITPLLIGVLEKHFPKTNIKVTKDANLVRGG